jgi:hypothetical protein
LGRERRFVARRVKARSVPRLEVVDLRGCGGENCLVYSRSTQVNGMYGFKTRRPEDDAVESKHVALISHYMFNITTVVFD